MLRKTHMKKIGCFFIYLPKVSLKHVSILIGNNNLKYYVMRKPYAGSYLQNDQKKYKNVPIKRITTNPMFRQTAAILSCLSSATLAMCSFSFSSSFSSCFPAPHKYFKSIALHELSSKNK